MLLRCAATFCFIFAARSAFVERRNIPVEIVYDKSNLARYANRNLDAKIQLSPDELLRLKFADEIVDEGPEGGQSYASSHGVRNLNEKIQLSPEELGQASTFSPDTVGYEETETSLAEENVAEVQPLIPEKLKNNTLFSFLQKAQEIVYSGINSIRNNIDQATDIVTNAKPSAEAWEKLNRTLDQFFNDQYKSVGLKDETKQNNNENTNQVGEYVNTFVTNIMNIVNAFGQNNSTQSGQKPEDEQQQGSNPLGSLLSNGWTQVINNVFSATQNQNGTSGQEDTGTGSGGIFGNFGSGGGWFQQFFGGTNQGNSPSQSANANQSDTGVQPPLNQGGAIINQINQFFNPFRPSPPTDKPAQGDEGSATTPSSNPVVQGIDQTIQNVSQSFQNIVNLRPPQAGGSGPSIPGSQILGQVIPGQAGTGGAAGTNPILSGAETIGSQIGQFGSNLGSALNVTTEKSKSDNV